MLHERRFLKGERARFLVSEKTQMTNFSSGEENVNVNNVYFLRGTERKRVNCIYIYKKERIVGENYVSFSVYELLRILAFAVRCPSFISAIRCVIN